MRSTNIVLFLVALNAAAIVVSGVLGPAIGIQPNVGGDGTIGDATESARSSFQSSRSGVGEFVSATFMVADFLRVIDNVVFAGPNMLISLGAPPILINPFKGLVALVVAIDLGEVISGRVLS